MAMVIDSEKPWLEFEEGCINVSIVLDTDFILSNGNYDLVMAEVELWDSELYEHASVELKFKLDDVVDNLIGINTTDDGLTCNEIREEVDRLRQTLLKMIDKLDAIVFMGD